MTANKPEVVAWIWDYRGRHMVTTDYSQALELAEPPYPTGVEPLIRLSDYERLQAETERLQAECEKMRKDAERSQAAFCAVIEYMLGDGRRDDPLEFLSYWTEGDFESVKEGWPEAPAVIYYADPMADHDAIDAAIQESPK